MDQFFSFLKWCCEQAYIYIPTILAFISAIGIPSLISIAKIVSNTATQIKISGTLKEGTSAITKAVNDIVGVILVDYEEELKELELEKQLTINKKLKELYDKKIERVKACIEKYKNLTVEELIKKAEEIEIPKKKIKVKVIKQ